MGSLSRFRVNITATLILIMMSTSLYAGTLVTGDVLRNARNNAVDPVFAEAMRDSTVLGAAIRYLVTENEADGQEAKVGTLRAALDAHGYLPDAHALPSDVSSMNLYNALLAYELISSGTGLFTPEDREGLKRTCMTVLDYYLDPAFCDWNDDNWALGISAMRIVASCALFSSAFDNDTASDRYRQHALRYLSKNIRDGIDKYGAWTSGSPGCAGEAIEYITITAKVLRALGFEDFFASPRLTSLLTSGFRLFPPRQSVYTREYLTLSIGRTASYDNSSRQVMLAATDINPYFPDEASELVWYWHECGSPVDPLSVLFIDSGIPYMRPNMGSAVAGGGTVVLRDRFATSSESMVSTVFGDARGITDRERWDHYDAGDFSFIWNGFPVVFHDGYIPDTVSEQLLNRQSWRHSTVLPYGAGDSPELPELAPVFDTGQNTVSGLLGDFYPDGLAQFMATPLLDYTAGHSTTANYEFRVFSHSRNLLFMKPNALVVWDEVSATGPVEWNLWMPVVSASSASNTLNILTRNGIELQAVFAGQASVNFTLQEPPSTIAHDWPILMRAPFGEGSITVLSIDAARAATSIHASIFTQLLINLAAPAGTQPIGLFDGSGTIISLLNSSGLTVVPFTAGVPDLDELVRFGTVMINASGSVPDLGRLMSARQILENYVRQGGRIVWVGAEREGIDSGTPDNPGLIPVSLASGTLPVEPVFEEGTDAGITVIPDQVWTSPNQISADSFRALVDDLCTASLFTGYDDTPAVTVPPAWSAAWQTIASVQRSFPVQTAPDGTSEFPSRIRVTRQNTANGILTLLLPRKQGEPYRFTVTNHSANYIAFSDPVSAWEVAAGPTSWSDARFSAKHTAAGSRITYWAFDCTTLTLGMEKVTALHPFTIFYDATEDRGIIQTAVDNELTFSGGMVKLHAGEMSFNSLSANIVTRRNTYITNIRVVDSQELPIPQARITVDGSFAGETDNQGYLPVRWSDYQPAVSIRYGSLQSSGLLVPGQMTFMLDSFRP